MSCKLTNLYYKLFHNLEIWITKATNLVFSLTYFFFRSLSEATWLFQMGLAGTWDPFISVSLMFLLFLFTALQSYNALSE